MNLGVMAMTELGLVSPAGVEVVRLVVGLVAGLFALGLGVLVYVCFSLPLRRAERAHLFLDILETAVERGQGLERAVTELSAMDEMSMGPSFHLVAAHVESGKTLTEALEAVPNFLPPQIVEMLKVGFRFGDLRKILPACRHVLEDAKSKTQGAESYLLVIMTLLLPVAPMMFGFLMVFIFPKFLEIAGDMGTGISPWARFLLEHGTWLFLPMVLLTLLIWILALLYLMGPGRLRSAVGFDKGLGDRLVLWLPWRWRRLQRDFSGLLAVLLDAGVPESEGLTLAAQGTANRFFVEAAVRGREDLRQGKALSQAMRHFDQDAEFTWRLDNAARSQAGFRECLRGWQEALEAKAYQAEQTASHLITTTCVVLNGIVVGVVVTGVFSLLIGLMEEGVLW
ncbi:MAG TPA: type II secretion system F family protein [Verrucomicrobiota bacterium]|nr:type II secretion system F family protein [Verrucomicrobiota bacterium]